MNRPFPASLQEALQGRGVRLVECCLADYSSVARGKVVDAGDFLAQGGCRMSSVVFGLGLTAGNPPGMFGPILPPSYPDIELVPDPATVVDVPGRAGRASVLCEPAGPLQGTRYPKSYDASELSPRAALRRVTERLAAAGFRARVAPELEFFLVERSAASADVLQAPAPGAGCAREMACEAFSLERAEHFGAYFEELYAACRTQNIPASGHGHEAAWSQFEVNFHPGGPLAQADAVFRFKRLAREIAARHGFLATFAAKPFLDQPGTGMHWHFSLWQEDGSNAFAGAGEARLRHFLGGLQRHAAGAMAVFAPYDHSWDRIRLADSSPTNASWGEDDRAAAFRIPLGRPENRRVENRLPGADSSPYLVVALTLGLGLLGIEQGIEPAASPPALPGSLAEALEAMDRDPAIRSILGEVLVDAYCCYKRGESAARCALPDPRRHWDLVHLVEQA